ncbi:hypothetical protein [Treponema sp.]|uniref:hypothetical protein n=1 Tax=Treponema sp. TaxID=166 RepID=UPI003F0A08C2
MSRSYQKTIAWGKSNNGGCTRHNKTWGDYTAEKAKKEGVPVIRQHHRHNLQTLEDYIKYVENDCNTHTGTDDMYDRRNLEELRKWINENGDCAASLIEFARNLYNKHRTK